MKGLRRTLVALLSATLMMGTAHASQDYQLLDDYFAQHPQQRQLTHAFRTQVEAAPQPLTQPLKQPVRIAVIYPAQQSSDYWRRSIEVFSRRLDELQIDYQLHTHFSALQESDLLHRQMRAALDSDPDYLIFTLDSLTHRRLIERLLARERPKVILQNITTPVSDWQDAQPLLYAGFDHREGSQILASTLFQEPTTAPRKISVIFRDRGYVSTMRGQTFIDAAKRHGATIASTYYTDGGSETARIAALAALDESPDLDLIYACSTDVGLGVAAALKERGLQRKVKVNGWGGGREELAAVEQGELDLTVVRLNEESSIAMAEAIKNDLSGRPVPQVYNGRMEALTLDHSPTERAALAERAYPHSGNSR